MAQSTKFISPRTKGALIHHDVRIDTSGNTETVRIKVHILGDGLEGYFQTILLSEGEAKNLIFGLQQIITQNHT